MNNTLNSALETYAYNEEIDKKVENVMENVLGISFKTKLEKLADSFSNVKYCVHRDKENKDRGWIEFAYKGRNYFKKEEAEIRKVAERFYNKDDYMIITTTFDYGFNITILDNFVKKAFKEVMKKKTN